MNIFRTKIKILNKNKFIFDNNEYNLPLSVDIEKNIYKRISLYINSVQKKMKKYFNRLKINVFIFFISLILSFHFPILGFGIMFIIIFDGILMLINFLILIHKLKKIINILTLIELKDGISSKRIK